ncbi:hypothetical protein F53441_2647 [Fusarium austroafricanum]|uniref:Uncharacterized protein n=1 Tax=Fusarium austroafricanum TaxID=2364996 RepID=A0A8H4P2N7_9HYPO|nr:hypothetical protein F53441_2647 [Fusarium austroafricanum]
MLFKTTLLSLVASVSAIDAYLGWSDKPGNKIVCLNLGADTCCGADGTGFTWIEFREIPTAWDLQLRYHRRPRCGAYDKLEPSRGRKNVQMKGGPWGGAGYGFNNKSSDHKIKCVKPSFLEFADGVQYDLSKLDDAPLNEMVQFIPKGLF